MAVLEEMLRELESSKRGQGKGADEDDQFVASLRLRLAQEYAAHNIEMQAAESLAVKAWQVRPQNEFKGSRCRHWHSSYRLSLLCHVQE